MTAFAITFWLVFALMFWGFGAGLWVAIFVGVLFGLGVAFGAKVANGVIDTHERNINGG